jgi:hypothetical protein
MQLNASFMNLRQAGGLKGLIGMIASPCSKYLNLLSEQLFE